MNSRRTILALAACLFLVVLGARWALLSRYGSDLPEWDQWDAEGFVLLRPAAAGQLHAATFFQPHNEHRIVLTRLLSFGLIEANGQWDQRVEAACNAVLFATIPTALWLLAAGRLSRGWRLGFYGALAAAYALPLAWENVLMGFDSQQFFLISLAIGGIVWLPFAEPYRPRWWLGAACVLLSLGSMGSGFFVAVIVAGLLTYQLERAHRPLRAVVPALVVCAAAIATGVMTRVIFPGHEPLKAHSAADFGLTVVKALGWPAFDFNWSYLALLLFLPWAILTWRLLRPVRPGAEPQPPRQRWHELLMGLGLWVLAQVLATAYARGNGGPSPAFRYMDTLIIGNLVNLLCLAALWLEAAQMPRVRRLCRSLTIGWAALFAAGVASEARYVWADQLPDVLTYHRYAEQNVRNYLATKDGDYLHHAEIPYPDENVLKGALDTPALAERLPGSVRQPIAIAAASDANAAPSGFQREDSRVPQARNPLPSPGAGLAPAAPVLANAVTWGSYRATPGRPVAQWRSAPLRATPQSWLKFEVAGLAGQAGQSLSLRDAASDRMLAEVHPDHSPHDTWRSAYVRAPSGPFRIVALSEPAGWMAFSQPVEISAGSFWVRRLVAEGAGLAWAAGVAALILLGVTLQRRES